MSIGQAYEPDDHDIRFWRKCLDEGMAAEFSPDQYAHLRTRKQQDAYCQQMLDEAERAYAARQEVPEIEPEPPTWEVQIHLDLTGVIRNVTVYHHGKNKGERHFAGQSTTLEFCLTWANAHTCCDANLTAEHLTFIYS